MPALAAAATKSQPGPSLVEEQRSIETARAAVARGDSATALATLDDYDRVYGGGQFGPEALALRVEALSAAGQLGRARSLAAEFQRRYPHHPLLTRVQGAAQGGPPAKH
jgi:outer membrane protein assembly factor BamD (BamD/ComL family)